MLSIIVQSKRNNSSSAPLISVRAHMRKNIVGGRAWHLRACLRSALPSSAAGSLMMPSGAGRSYVSVCGYSCSSQSWSRMKRERSLKYDDGWLEPLLIARTAVTSADRRVHSSKVRVRLWITEEISSSFTLDHLSSPSDAAAAAADDDDDALNATCVIFLRYRPVLCCGPYSAFETPVRIKKMQDCHCFLYKKHMGITTPIPIAEIR